MEQYSPMCKQHADKARCIGNNIKTTVDNDFFVVLNIQVLILLIKI